MLEMIKVDPPNGLKELYGMMCAGSSLFIFENGRRIPLSTEFDKHPLWKDTEIWKITLQRIINLKFAKAVETLEKQRLEAEKQQAEKGFFGSIAKLFGDEKQIEIKLGGTLRINKTLAQSIVFNCMSTFVGYFVTLRMDFERARELMLHFTKKYELDQARTHLLLHDLEVGQKEQVYEITSVDIQNMSEVRKTKM